MPVGSRATGRVAVAVVIDAVNQIAEDLKTAHGIRQEFVARMAREYLRQGVPQVAWVVDRNGRLDACQGSPAVSL